MSDIPKIFITLPSGEVRKYSLQMDSIRIGRAPDNTVVIEDGSLSAHHAVLHLRESGYELVDLGSTNGLEIGGQRVFAHRMRHGDEVKIGSAFLRFDCPSMAPPPVETPAESPPPPLPAEPVGAAETTAEVGTVAKIPDGPAPMPTASLDPWKENKKEPEAKGGCLASLVLFILTLLAPAMGMHVRYYKETGGKILALDVMSHVNSQAKPVAPAP